jgi:hypothetical protein
MIRPRNACKRPVPPVPDAPPGDLPPAFREAIALACLRLRLEVCTREIAELHARVQALEAARAR